MDPQTNTVPGVPIKSNDKGQKLLVVLVLISVLLLAGLIYTNMKLSVATKTTQSLESRVTQLDGLSEDLKQVLETGSNDKILGIDKVKKDALQAVFLSGGRVYFGRITEITTKNVVMENVYYLKAGNDGSDQSLVKLGCEIHKPEDKLVINREKVELWENLKTDDKQGVSQAVKDYEKANPDGQKCS